MKKEIKDDSFVFYATVLDTVETLQKQGNNDLAIELLMSTIQYGIYGEYESTNPMVQAMMISISQGIDKAKDRRYNARENGKKGGRPKIVDDEQVALLRERGLTNQEIADELHVSVSSIEKSNQKNQKNLNVNVNVNDNVNVNVNNKKGIPEKPPEKEGYALACIKKYNSDIDDFEDVWEYFPSPEGFHF